MLIFLLIIGVPFVLVLGAFLRPELLEKVIREPGQTSAPTHLSDRLG